jgi:hypothetical protein
MPLLFDYILFAEYDHLLPLGELTKFTIYALNVFDPIENDVTTTIDHIKRKGMKP